MQSIAIIDNAREPLANGTIVIGLLLIAVVYLGIVRPAFLGEIQKPVLKLFLSALTSVIAIISMVFIYGYILHVGKLDSYDFIIGLAIMLFIAMTDSFLIDNVIVKDLYVNNKPTASNLKRKRIKL